MKAFPDNKMNVREKYKFVFERVGNTVGKEENASYQHFLLFPHCFLTASFSWLLKVRIVWQRVNPLPDMPVLGFSISAVNKVIMSEI